MSDLKHSSFVWLVELLAYWEGRVQPAQLASIHAISRQQASKRLREFLAQNSEALRYHSSEKTYRPTSKFFPRHINRDVGQYLSWVTGQSARHDAILAFAAVLAVRAA